MAERAAAAALPALLVLFAAEGAAAACTAPVAHLVSIVGEVRVNGELPTGTLPAIPVCPGDTVEVGPNSRAGAYLLDADTPLQLEEDTLGRFQPPPEGGSGVVELVRGAVYFLSEVRRTLTIRTPYVTAGVEGTEVYLRAGRPGAAGGAELYVLEGRVAVTPGERTPALTAQAATTGERLGVAPDGAVRRAALPGGDGVYGALRRLAVGELSWTLFYPDVLVADEARPFPRITGAARLLAAGRVDEAEAVLAGIPGTDGREAGLRDALRATVAFARKDAAAAARLAAAGSAAAPDAATPLVAQSYARQLALDLDGAVDAAAAAVDAAPRASLPHARLAELRLMRGETRAARREAQAASDLGGGPLADIALGYAELAALRGGAAEAAFRTALAAESANPLALLGLGLARIKQGHLAEGRQQIENAVAHDPSSSLLRSYLGKGYFEERRDDPAGKQLAIAKELDPSDPTPWFYDAIRKQLDNRPVEALRDLERSIVLNDNRAPFRSRLLLDQDRATRGVSLGRIYEDLGFEEAGRIEAAKALTLDPASAEAHRFLADLQLTRPRLEAARLSGLLRAQLLQPLGFNPLQPSLNTADLDLVAPRGPAAVGFNEFTPLFVGDGVQAVGTGIVGNHDTWGEEATISTVQGKTSLSIGQLFYRTNGFRKNFDLQHNVLDFLGQAQVTEWLQLQAGYQRRRSRSGDRELEQDLDRFTDTLDRQERRDLFRLGAQLKTAPGHTTLISLLHDDRERNSIADESPRGDTFQDGELNAKATAAEAQHIANLRWATLVAGGSVTRVDATNRACDQGRCDGPLDEADGNVSVTDLDQHAYEAYAETTGHLPGAIDLILRLGYDKVDRENSDTDGFTPGAGVIWSPTTSLTLRAAAVRTIKRAFVASQTLRPTQIAGFNTLFDDFDGTHSDLFAVGADYRFSEDIRIGAELGRRFLRGRRILSADDGGQAVRVDDRREDTAVVYVNWTPTSRWAFSFDLFRETYRARERDTPGEPLRVTNWLPSVAAHYFHPNGLFAGVDAALARQGVDRGNFDRPDTSESDDGMLVDAFIGYRLPKRLGILSFEASNLLDQRLNWQDDTFRSSAAELRPRFLPSRTLIARFTLNW